MVSKLNASWTSRIAAVMLLYVSIACLVGIILERNAEFDDDRSVIITGIYAGYTPLIAFVVYTLFARPARWRYVCSLGVMLLFACVVFTHGVVILRIAEYDTPEIVPVLLIAALIMPLFSQLSKFGQLSD